MQGWWCCGARRGLGRRLWPGVAAQSTRCGPGAVGRRKTFAWAGLHRPGRGCFVKPGRPPARTTAPHRRAAVRPASLSHPDLPTPTRGHMPEQARATRILTDIDPRSWEHPADRAALNALRKIPVFDEVLRKLFGAIGERQVRLMFLANAVRVSPTQHPKLHQLWADVHRTLDAPAQYPLYVTQNPTYNAAALGMDKPFVIVHSELLRDFEEDE